MTPPLLDDGGCGAVVRELPGRYARGPHPLATYWHLPRSARAYEPNGNARTLTVMALCGQMLHDPVMVDRPADGPICGTCTGRHMGLHQQPAISYRPQTVRRLPPKWCVGSTWGKFVWAPPSATAAEAGIPDRHVWCLGCGQVVRAWNGGAVRHEHHGRGVACPVHGTWWVYVDQATGWLRCTGHETGGGPCSRLPMPFWLLHA